MSGIVIVGAGQAAASLAAKSRSLGYTAPITIIGDETVPPYQRPPLSKDYLLGQTSVERLLLRAPAFWNEQDVTMRLGEPVTSINRTEKTVRVVGETLEYDQLVLATGSTPRLLPAELGGDLTGVYAIRGLNDVDAMVPEFCAGRRLLIIGGGYIGLEAAAVGAELGLAVTLIEMAPRILQRVASPETSSHFRELHRAHGFRILENTGIDRLIGDSRVSGAVLSDGTRLDVDFVIVGIGILPRTMLAEEAGLTVANGIATDGQGRTSDPNIWAAGECASFPAAHGEMRLESVGHAIDHGELVAANILGGGCELPTKTMVLVRPVFRQAADRRIETQGTIGPWSGGLTRRQDRSGITGKAVCWLSMQ
jgi:3-phenylpropionate/trans-cinnamate dioxygenase ferredoxin reductase subunit